MYMRWGLIPLLSVSLLADSPKLNFEQRVEIVRGLMAEYATAKVILPRSKKPLPYESKGTWDKTKWDDASKEFGPAARVGARSEGQHDPHRDSHGLRYHAAIETHDR